MKSAERIKNTGEVFTPRALIHDMLSRLPNSVWFDPNKRWLEPTAGDGNFLVEIKARLLQAGIPERHILNHQLFSIELIDDNHYVLQIRLGYLQEVDGYLVPGPVLEDDLHLYTVSKINRLTQDLNNFSPYAGKTVLLNDEPYVLQADEVYHHVNHRCASALDGIVFPGAVEADPLPLLPERGLGEWPKTDTPDTGEETVVSTYRANHNWVPRAPVINPPAAEKIGKPKKEPKAKVTKTPTIKPPKYAPTEGGGWQVKAEWIGKGLKIRCKSPVDGSFWECDHDALVAEINASLKAKGKPLIGEPGPSEKSYGSSKGLRCPELWTRV